MSLTDNQHEMIKCAKCGMTIHKSSSFCVHCGKMLRNASGKPSCVSNVIVHPKFGKGKIVEDKGLTVKILFIDGEEKVLLKEFVAQNCNFENIEEKERFLNMQKPKALHRDTALKHNTNRQSDVKQDEDFDDSNDLLDVILDRAANQGIDDWADFEKNYDGPGFVSELY